MKKLRKSNKTSDASLTNRLKDVKQKISDLEDRKEEMDSLSQSKKMLNTKPNTIKSCT